MGLRLRLRRLAVGSVVLGAGTACYDPADPVAPDATVAPSVVAEQVEARGNWTIDDHFRNTELRVPGFAGVHIESDGTLIVRVKNPAAPNADLLDAPIRDLLVGLGWPVERAGGLAATRRTVPADYSISELSRAHNALFSLLDHSDVHGIDIDEVRNRVQLSALPGRAEAVRGLTSGPLSARGLPPQIVFVVEEPMAMVSARRSTAHETGSEDLTGGVRIEGANAAGPAPCTLTGIIRHSPSAGTITLTKYAVTVSHCAYPFGTTTGMQIGHTTMAANPFATEIFDRPMTTKGCPIDRWAGGRNSDAALFEVHAGEIDHQFSHKYPTNALYGPQHEDFGYSRNALAGETVWKYGRTTLQTIGSVTNTCEYREQGDVNQFGQPVDSGRGMLCQMRASYVSDLGDSGGPVYVSPGQYTGGLPNDPDDFVGIHWGLVVPGQGPSWFSSNSNVKNELRPLGWTGQMVMAYCCF